MRARFLSVLLAAACPACRTAPELNRHLDDLIKQLQDIREQGLVYLAGIFRE